MIVSQISYPVSCEWVDASVKYGAVNSDTLVAHPKFHKVYSV